MGEKNYDCVVTANPVGMHIPLLLGQEVVTTPSPCHLGLVKQFHMRSTAMPRRQVMKMKYMCHFNHERKCSDQWSPYKGKLQACAVKVYIIQCEFRTLYNLPGKGMLLRQHGANFVNYIEQLCK